MFSHSSNHDKFEKSLNKHSKTYKPTYVLKRKKPTFFTQTHFRNNTNDMASITAAQQVAAASQVLLSHGFDNVDVETATAILNAAKSHLKTSGKKTRNSPQKKKSSERADAPFNPKCCSARLFVLECHPCEQGAKPKTLYGDAQGTIEKTDQEDGTTTKTHVGLLNVQCSGTKLNDDGLCSRHADTSRFSNAGRCHQTGELYLGLYNQVKPQNPVRYGDSGNIHKYVWIENVTEEMQQSKSSPARKSRSPQKQSTSTEKYDDFNWNVALSSGDINGYKLPRLKLYLKKHSMPERDDDGKMLKKNDVLASIIHHIKAKFIPQDDDEPNEQQEDQEQQNDQMPPPLPLENADQQAVDDLAERRQRMPNTANAIDAAAQENNSDDEDDDDEMTEQENEESTFTTPDGVTYDVEDNELYDPDTGEFMANLVDGKIEWRKSSMHIHAQNMVKKMQEKM